MHSQDFTFTALPKELVSMSEELDALGGGDTRVGRAEAYCRLAPHNPPEAVFTEGDMVIVRDPRTSSTAPHKQATRKYHVNGILPQSQEETFNLVGDPILNWLWDGFNSVVMTIGQVGMGKTYTLFGRDSWDLQIGVNSTQGIFIRMLTNLFARIGQHGGKSQYIVGIAVWDILESSIIDLLAPESEQAGKRSAADVITVRADNLAIAMQLVEVARSRSVNWSKATPTGVAEFLPNRGHHFVRVTLYNVQKQWVSYTQIVDLVGHGHSSVPGIEPGGSHIATVLNRERQVARQQLVGLGRIISELAKAGAASVGTTLISTRDSILSQTIGPLLAGNCKSIILATVSTHRKDFAETVHTLRFAKRVQNIATGCVRTLGITIDTLKLWPPEDILPTQHPIPKVPQIVPQLYSSLPISAISPHSSSSTSQQLGFENDDIPNDFPQSPHSPGRTWRAPVIETAAQPRVISYPTPTSAIKQQIRHVMESLDSEEHYNREPGINRSAPEGHGSTGDIHLLQRNYASILNMLQQEQQLKTQFATRAAAAEKQTLETSLTYQLEIEELQGENLQLRALLRKMEHSTDFAEVFAVYERDMSRIAQEIRRLRDENLELNEKLEIPTGQPVSVKKPWASSSSSVLHELDVLREDSQRQDRKNMVHLRIIDDTSRKLAEVTQQLRAKDLQTSKLEGLVIEMRAHLDKTEAEKGELENSVEFLKTALLKEKTSVEYLEQELSRLRDEYLRVKRTQVLSKMRVPQSKEIKKTSPSIAQLFDRLRELGMVDQKYETLLSKLKKEIGKLEQELTNKELEQQRLLAICIENLPQSDEYFTNIERFQELLHSKINTFDAIVTKPRNKDA